jgi:hypothetical protein
MSQFKPKSPDEHPLHWGDKELAYMVSRQKRADGKVKNLTVLYSLMGYDGRNPTEAFKKRVERLTSDKH